ncbi:cytochrome P450 [Artomyces pyxidatus]|uniref:Cytochrome P450 n=1 Tax=Artomyces pyxidatus TaxID=48021 RepID=A0ACB8SU85_9AGAM|nr:cytochrome P450 [Artomyces pyxidatus]
MFNDRSVWLHDPWLSIFALSCCAIVGMIFLTCATLLISVVRKLLRQASLRTIHGPPSVSLFSGNLTQMFNHGAAKFHKHLNDTYGRVYRITGFFGASVLVISDTHAVANILVKKDGTFERAPGIVENNRLVWGPGLLAATGAHHRRQRKMLNPIFAPRHLRSLVPLFHRVTRQLVLVLRQLTADEPREIELVDWLGRLSLELLSQGGLGYTFDSFNPNAEEHEFAAAIQEYMPTTSSLYVFQRIAHLLPRWPRFLRLCAFRIPSAKLHNVIRISDIIHKYSVRIFEEKKALLAKGDEDFTRQLSEGKDLISLLMRENEDSADDVRLPDEEIIGQIGTFLFAGTETTAVALSRILLLLAQNSDVQERLRSELNNASVPHTDGELTYEALSELPYLEAVCHETLRVYAPVAFISRAEDVAVPLSRPIETSDGPLSAIFVPQGTDIVIPSNAINRSKDIWGADAEEWKPERFLSPFPDSVAKARIPGVYSNTMTFSAGGSSCMYVFIVSPLLFGVQPDLRHITSGFKFSELEMKVALSHLVRSFRFSPSQAEIVWKYGGITTPAVKGTDTYGPKLPMVVERL